MKYHSVTYIGPFDFAIGTMKLNATNARPTSATGSIQKGVSPHSNHDRARAELVPTMPTWASDQLMKDEHQDALSSYPRIFVSSWYSVMRGLLDPGG